MTIEPRAVLRLAGAGAAVVALMFGSAYLGAHLGQRGTATRQAPVAAPSPAAPETGDALADLVDTACPAIVAVQRSGGATGATGAGAATGSGGPTPSSAGFLISADGYLVTSLAGLGGQTGLRILLNDGRSFDATLAGEDQLSGLALLKIGASGLPVLAFADSHFPRTGAQGIVLAAPNGSGCLAQAGMISGDFLAEQSGLWAYVEIRPALDPELPGAPFLDHDGHVAGIAGLRVRSADSPVSRLLPGGTAARIVSELLRNGRVPANRFGLVADDLLPELAARAGVERGRGAVIALVRDGSPAGHAGLKAGDVVLSAAGAPVSSASELSRALDTDEPRITLEVSRHSTRLVFNLDTAAAPHP